MTKTYFIADDNGTIYAHDIDSLAKAEATLSDILTAHPEYKDLGLEVLTDEDDEQTPVYFIADDCTTAAATCDLLPLTVANEAEALKQAWAAWNRLAAHDQRKRDSFCLCYGVLDEDGIPEDDYDEIIDIVKAAPVYAAFDEDAAEIRAELKTEMEDGYRQAMDADLELRLDDLRKQYKEQYPDLF